MICLSQWFIMLCLWLYCISITKKSDMSITVIYHAMSLTTVSVSLRRVICLSQWFIMVCLWLYCISITKKSDMSHSDLSCYVSDCTVSVSLRRVICPITVIYHAMSLTTVSVSLRRVICLLQWFIILCFWLYCISIT